MPEKDKNVLQMGPHARIRLFIATVMRIENDQSNHSHLYKVALKAASRLTELPKEIC